ncbi:MAG: sensor domain-containing diguanylate cyclase [Myxococcaceae bacterium]|nr:sensor domain-containing diguanylate cyclase [Myxococcaceae bacterium]
MAQRLNLHRQPFTPWPAIRAVVRAVPAVAIVGVFSLLARGGFRHWSAPSLLELAGLTAILASVGLTVWRYRRRASAATLREELELGGAVLATAFVAVALAGPAIFPLVYLVVAVLVTFVSRGAGLTLLAAALVFDAMEQLPGSPATLGVHAAFLLVFAVLYHGVLAARLRAARSAEENAVKNRIAEVEERARTFRLVNAGTNDSLPGAGHDEKWLLASVKEIEGTLGNALEIAETALKTHSVGVFLLTSDDRSLKLHDCRSQSERVQRERFPAGEGILGALLKRAVPVRMASANGVKGINWYDEGGPTVRSILAVPIVETKGLVRGVLVADRLEYTPFQEEDERLLSTVAAEVLRAVEVERVMGYIRKARDEKERFFRAIEELNRAGAPDQVFLAVLESARQIAPVDFCAVTLVAEEAGQRTHRIVRMTGVTAPGRGLEGRTFPDNHGLVANVVRYGAPLPGREIAMERQVIFDAELQVRALAALKIFPLLAGDRILGTLVAGSRKKGAFDGDALRMLEVIAGQAGQAVLRAQLYEQMERMATTDGLTNLLNHRTFQSRFDDALGTAKRYGRRLSLILTDIDHFKSVNDTYGHPTGDQVLRGVARILKAKARDVDLVARYGGEEFAIIMPETDEKGAKAIAERIREAVEAEVFQTEQGPLKITLSLGIATFPEASQEKQALVDLADQCLYFAKRHGRNQSVTVAQLQPGRRQTA